MADELALERRDDDSAGGSHGPAATPADTRPRTDWWGEFKGLVWLVLAVLGFHSFIAKPFYIPSESMMPGLLVGDRLVVTKYPYGYSYVSPTFHLLPFVHGRLFGSLPERGDVVIASPIGGNTDYIKRVIGLPGDRLQVRGGVVWLNGRPIPRVAARHRLMPVDPNNACDPGSYPGAQVTGADGKEYCRLPIYRETLPNGRSYDTIDLGYRPEADDFGPVTVPADHVFLMGDNRDNSADSRFPVAQLGLGGAVPWENIGGRAEFVTFSLDGRATWNPLTWPASLRSGRFGLSLHPQRQGE
jgi:signal peptidase I